VIGLRDKDDREAGVTGQLLPGSVRFLHPSKA